MPGLAQRNEQFSYSLSSSATGFWSKHRDDVSFNQLQKFWNELSPRARQELLRIDKQALFEQARKNMYCSRCNGLLLEGFMQIVAYGKSLQQEGVSRQLTRPGALRVRSDGDSSIVDEIPDPAVHPWGGLTTTREGLLTLMDCYLYAKSLKGLQNVFDCARTRERERELLYPDACGGGGRGWISQGMIGYGRGHGTRETCALHTARLSCDTLVDFWSALGDETRQSLLRMKEEDFIERLMYRFDSKRFCRDCRRNVIREFKELKELKRMRREPRCTSWFCVADTAFDYEVSDDTIHADWHNTFADAAGTYHYFEWGVGTGEGKTDIIEFENVGMNGSVKVDGLDLSGLSACFITLRAWKRDGRFTDLCVKAHALKSGQCVHSRLVVGDGFVAITRGESIRRFFEHAEEAEEEEDDDSMDKDGNDLDGECSRPQKHAKSPELAREFLLDAATVIFKEQVEKAFREGTARQNAHSIFVCLALKLLEDRVHVACKEIITLEKQMKLLEEEEKEKREEEERKERRRAKEREKKLRRKERLKGKERDKDKSSCGENQAPDLPEVPEEEASLVVVEDPTNSVLSCCNLVGEAGEKFPYMAETQMSSDDCHDGRFGKRYANDPLTATKYSRRRPKGVSLDVFLKWSERRRFAIASGRSDSEDLLELRCPDDTDQTTSNAASLTNKQVRANDLKLNGRSGPKFCEKFHCSGNGRTNERYDFNHCSCSQNTEYRPKTELHVSSVKVVQETKSVSKSEADQIRDNCGRPKSKFLPGNNHLQSKKVWEPLESQKKHPRSNSESDVTLKSSSVAVQIAEPNNCLTKSSNDSKEIANSTRERDSAGQNGIHIGEDSFSSANFIKSASDGSSDPVVSISSSSDNCSSCLSEEGDSNTTSSNTGNNDSSSTSDSEDSSLQSDGKETLDPVQSGISECHKVGIEKNMSQTGEEQLGVRSSSSLSQPGMGTNAFEIQTTNGLASNFNHQSVVSSLHNQNLQPFPVFQPPSALGYYHQNPVSWTAPQFSHPNPYLYAGPLGYSMGGDSHFCMQYPNPIQHLATPPLYTPGPIPYYHPIAEQTRILNQHAPKQQEATNNVATEEITDRIGLRSTQAALSREGVQNDDLGKAHSSDTSFSLFHWGGPVALSNPLAPTQEGVGEFLVKCPVNNGGEENNPGSFRKETAVEEYNLFAASNTLRFSFF